MGSEYFLDYAHHTTDLIKLKSKVPIIASN